ncbi:MAG: hypothetical protein V3V95_08140 [Thermodesulfobacteriota bacterium]
MMSEHEEHSHDELFVELSVTLEEDQLEELKKLAKEYAKELDQDWDVSAVIRVAVGDFLNKLGRIL